MIRSKRSRDEFPSPAGDLSSSADDNILREAATLASSGDYSDPSLPTQTPSRKRHLADEEVNRLDRFSLRIVSSLQGSSTLDEAQSRAKEVLVEFSESFEQELRESQAKMEKLLAANKVLGRALHIMKNKLTEAQSTTESDVSDLRQRLAEAEERAKTAEQTVNVLRWHLQHDAGKSIGGIRTPPDVF